MKSDRRRWLVPLIVFCVLVVSWPVLVHLSSDDHEGKSSASAREPVEAAGNPAVSGRPDSAPEAEQHAPLTSPPPAAKTFEEEPASEQITRGNAARPASIPRWNVGILAVAVADCDRLLAERVTEQDSAEVRAAAIRAIQRASGICAAARRLDLVFDKSGKTLNGIPVVLSGAGLLDLTEEVRRELVK